MKPDAKLYEENTDAVIKCEKHYILAFEYIKKSLDRLCRNFNKYRDIQKEIVVTLVYIIEIIKQMVNRLHPIFYFAINSFRKMKRLCLLIMKLSNKLI